MTYDLKEVGAMVESVLMNMDAIIYVDRFAVGANDGGRYVSLYNSRLKLRLVNVYHEQFGRLPKFISDRIEELADDVDVPVKLARAEKSKRIHICTKFKATRYRRPLKEGEDSTASGWKFGAVLRVFNQNRDRIDSGVTQGSSSSTGGAKPEVTEEDDPLINQEQMDVLRDLMRVIFEDEKEKQAYLEACLSQFEVNALGDVRLSQLVTWKKYLDARLQAKFNGLTITRN